MTNDIIERPSQGTIIKGIDHARISCRKYDGPNKVRETGTHHAFQFSMKGNVIIKIERCYIINKPDQSDHPA